MMNKNIFYIILSLILISSCQEININKEVHNTSLLDSVLVYQQELIEKIDSLKVNSCIAQSSQRIKQFESPRLNTFQKQWLHPEKIAYQHISENLKVLKPIVDSIQKEFNYTQDQIQTLKEDLIHRHLSKETFKQYFIDEQKALAELGAHTKKLHTIYSYNCLAFDSLEFKLQGIITQLDALQNEYIESHEN
jgi:hypothetical protein